MASERDRSDFVEALPSHPSLEMQQKRAKNLLRAATSGDADALRRLRALHPKSPEPSALKLADAQLVVARGYGFDSWARMRQKIDALTKTPLEQFYSGLHAGDVEQVRTLLENHAEVRAQINGSGGPFGSRPAMSAKRNLPMLDLLLTYGADLDLKVPDSVDKGNYRATLTITALSS